MRKKTMAGRIERSKSNNNNPALERILWGISDSQRALGRVENYYGAHGLVVETLAHHHQRVNKGFFKPPSAMGLMTSQAGKLNLTH